MLALLIGVTAGLGQACPAGPLDKSYVDGNARWVVHVDMEAMRRSAVGREVLSARGPASLLDEVRRDLGLDPLSDIRSVTVYGMCPGEPVDAGAKALEWSLTNDAGVVVIICDESGDDVPGFLERAERRDFVQRGAGDDAVYSWAQHGRSWYLSVRKDVDSADRLVFITEQEDLLGGAVAVAVGQRRDLAESVECSPDASRVWPLCQRPSPGCMVFAMARTGPWEGQAGPAPRARLLRGARGVVVDIGERARDGAAPEFRASARLRMQDESTAREMQSFVQGVISVACLNASDAPQPLRQRLLNAVECKLDGADLRVSLRWNAQEVTSAIAPSAEPAHVRVVADRPATPPAQGPKNPTDAQAPAQNPPNNPR